MAPPKGTFVSDPAAPGELVLVVDHDALFRASVREPLERAGFYVLEADDGEEALEAASRRKPELVLLDVCLPGASGYEVCKRLAKRRPIMSSGDWALGTGSGVR